MLNNDKKITNEIITYIETFLKKTFKCIGVEVGLEIEKIEDVYEVNLETEKKASLIGKGGQNLDALQKLLRSSLQNQFQESIKIRIELAGYRKKQEEVLKQKIQKIAQDVINTQMDISLEPMNAYQRRIVHETIKKYSELKTESKGESPDRYIIISFKD